MCDMVGIIEHGQMLAVGSVADRYNAKVNNTSVPGCNCQFWGAPTRHRNGWRCVMTFTDLKIDGETDSLLMRRQ